MLLKGKSNSSVRFRLNLSLYVMNRCTKNYSDSGISHRKQTYPSNKTKIHVIQRIINTSRTRTRRVRVHIFRVFLHILYIFEYPACLSNQTSRCTSRCIQISVERKQFTRMRIKVYDSSLFCRVNTVLLVLSPSRLHHRPPCRSH
jgi:hypothetical protein